MIGKAWLRRASVQGPSNTSIALGRRAHRDIPALASSSKVLFIAAIPSSML